MPASGLIAICIVTCRRPAGLSKLLTSLETLNVTDTHPVELVIVDNDPANSARSVIDSLDSRFPLHFIHETEPGIPFARNRALREAERLNVEFIAFLDDDEFVEPDWLEQLLRVQTHHQADIVWGPVYPVYAATPPDWLVRGGFHDRQRYTDGTVLTTAASNNVLIRLQAIIDRSLRFNEAMRHTGGTDHLFFCQAARAGCRIVWAEHARVHEDVPADRLTVAWLSKRFLRLGNTHTMTELALSPGGGTRTKLLLQGLVRLAAGGAGLIVAPMLDPVSRVKARRSYFRGLGMVSSLFNRHHNEYKPS